MSAAGWYPVARADVETILDNSGEKNSTSLVAVWNALLSLANAGGSCELTAPVNAIARAAGLSYKPTLSALRYLATIGLLKIEERHGQDRRNREPSKYTIMASVSPCVKTPQGLGQNSPRVRESGRRLLTENNTNNSSKEENNETREAACAALTLTADNFFEKAREANGARLTPTELQRFVDYWTEANGKGRCRYQGEKFFELPKRIGTWASRERVATVPTAAAKPKREVWPDCAARCRFWNEKWTSCDKKETTQPASCDRCYWFNGG